MVLLNLLPHREQARWRQRRHWHGMLGVALGVAVLAGVALYAQGQQRLGRQERATAVLEEAVARLGPQLAEVRKLDAALREGRTRLQQWQAWQQSARQPLRLLELLARELPPGTGLTRVEQEPGQMVLQGLAVSREAEGLAFSIALASSWTLATALLKPSPSMSAPMPAMAR